MKIAKEALDAYNRFVEYNQLGFTIIYVDEVMFTKNTMVTHCYSPKNHPF